MDNRTDEQVKAEYDRNQGFNAKDYGAKAVILREAIANAKKRGYKTVGFRKMKKSQLYRIANKLF